MPARQTLDLSFFHSNQAESVWQENLREAVLGQDRNKALAILSSEFFGHSMC